MDVIFQDYQGVIEALTGASFSHVKAIVDEKRQNILLVWLKDNTRDCWYRIYVDEFCCGVDRYITDESFEDEEADDDLKMVEYSKWFVGKKLARAEVKSKSESNGSHIFLLLNFEDNSSAILEYAEDAGKCTIKFI